MDIRGHFLILGYINFCFSLISIIFCLLICVFYGKYGHMKINFQAKLIFFVAFIDMISALSSMIPSLVYVITYDNIFTYSEALSYFFGVLRVFSEFLEFFTTTLITYSLHLAINKNFDVIKNEKKYFIILFTFPIILTLIPVFVEIGTGKPAYGEADQINCWLLNEYCRIFVFFLTWLVLTLLNLYYIYKIKHGLREPMYQDKNFSKKLIYIPIILFICYIFNFVRRILNNLNDLDGDTFDPLVVVYFMFICMPLLGFFNSIVLGSIDDGVRERIKALFLCDMQKFQEIDEEHKKVLLLMEEDTSFRCFAQNNKEDTQ